MSKMTTGHTVQARRVDGHEHACGGIAAGTIILTLDGALPVEHLTPGDRVITRSSPRVLRGVSVRSETGVSVVRIGASTLGPDRPDDDILVAPGQPVLVRDWRARALYGAERAMVPAHRLVDGEFIRTEEMADLRLFTLDLGGPAVIYAGNQELGIEPETAPA
ncbi:Hint domain-containing protein [Acidimangrovimonas sediminis]|uniref:Hint domain-containing protein n=1 Tax=Acidimangrovimonas sediminis TaxID=2056283 RepID=UPI001E400411|nr:Hint domain-containing protein [Acidimangrovimonas sediminis]